MDRREFLRNSFLAALGLAVTANTPASMQRVLEPPKPTRVAGRINPRTASVDELWDFIKPFATEHWEDDIARRARQCITVLAFWAGRTRRFERKEWCVATVITRRMELDPQALLESAECHKREMTKAVREYRQLRVVDGKLLAYA